MATRQRFPPPEENCSQVKSVGLPRKDRSHFVPICSRLRTNQDAARGFHWSSDLGRNHDATFSLE
jgi:hypothetical protein